MHLLAKLLIAAEAIGIGRDALARGLVLSLSGVSALATLAITAWSRRERLASH